MLSSRSLPRRRPLGGRPFQLLLASLAVSSCGDWVYNVALLALVFERTHSGTWVAVTTAARVLPIVLLGPVGGVMANRHNRRTLIIGADLVRTALMVALALVAAAGLPVVLAPLIAAAATAAGSVVPPCVAASTARLVQGPELQRANARRSAVGQAAIVVGPALGALVLVLSAPAVAILLNALTFIASAVAVWLIGSSPTFVPSGAGESVSGVLDGILAGARALRRAPGATRLIAADTICSAVYGTLTVLFVLLGRQLGAGNGAYGLLMGAYGIGGVLGALVTGRVANPARWRMVLIAALLLVATTLVALGSGPTLLEALAAALVGGGGLVVGEVLADTALPHMLDDDILASAYGLAVPVSIGGIVVGSLLAGPLVSLLGVGGALTAVGLAVVVAGGALVGRPLVVAVPEVA
ncbi:MAG TPA: MFS transporter [Solirubrobacteraceae bacterium]|jgi:predicted MFS family arabinose efflux permease